MKGEEKTCGCTADNRRVVFRCANHAKEGGFDRNSEQRSTIVCIKCGAHWSTRASWVKGCKDLVPGEYKPELFAVVK